jgi:sulfide:quinone oxidoreductase
MRILVVGGGTAGTIVANNLARRLTGETRAGKVRITLLSATDRHMYQPGLLYVAFGHMTPDQLYRDEASLLEPNIDFHVDPVTKFNLDKNQVLTAGGKTHDYDILVIATGSRMVPDETPGLNEGAEFFYTEASAVKMFKRLREFQGGKVVVAVGVPHKCPIAPVEVMFMLHDYFKARGIRDKVQLKYHYPIGRIHTIENVAIWAKPEFDDRRRDRDPVQHQGSGRQEQDPEERGGHRGSLRPAHRHSGSIAAWRCSKPTTWARAAGSRPTASAWP